MKKMLIIVMLLSISLLGFTFCDPNDTGDSGDGGATFDDMIIDHTCTNLSLIPSQWIETVKTSTNVLHYAKRSHGSQLTTGGEDLMSDDATYAFDAEWCGLPDSNVLGIWNGQLSEDYITPELYWSTPSGLNTTHSVLENNTQIKYSMWSWCTELDSWSESEVQDYLDTIADLESDFPNVVFIYMTGNAQAGGEGGWNRAQRNAQIRQYCETNKKVLFDFEDLDSWYNGDQDTDTYNEHVFPIEHSHYSGDYNGSHTTRDSCINKAKALWWMMARLEGWEE